ncbi:anoctamin-7-like isoform X3 [Varroa destructor]|uniref:Anoctamin n=1 Tax=Varroa destructor TaxID=109461 RepID=A0A7M7KQS4_VARDE|nr:anoctamin-7-like isoform X3 [Varroa destructor]
MAEERLELHGPSISATPVTYYGSLERCTENRSAPTGNRGQLTAGGGGDDDRCALLPHSTGPSGCNSASGHPMALKSKYGDLSNVGDLKTARINHRQDSQSPPFTDDNDSSPSDKGLQRPIHRNVFRDGATKIDYVLVYEEVVDQNASSNTASNKATTKMASNSAEETGKQSRKARKAESWRDSFLQNLELAGLYIEEEVVEVLGERKKLHFIKLSAPWEVLVDYAEALCFRAPLQIDTQSMTKPKWPERPLGNYLQALNIFDQEVPNEPIDYYTCPFKKAKLVRFRFLGSSNHDEYFTTTQRIRIVHEILQKTEFGRRRKAHIGLDRLLEESIFTAAYPLHEGCHKPPEDLLPREYSRRQVLFEFWVRWGRWYKFQPLNHIREYFGEKIAIYFAWLGLYTAWLLPAAGVGILVFIYGIVNVATDKPTAELCASDYIYRMCPRCEERYGCDFWYLSEICIFTKLTYLFDHPGTVFYSCFLSFWAVTFLEYWKRQCSRLAHQWDCMDYEEEEEPPRPEFAAKAYSEARNPVTGQREPSFPHWIRMQRIVAGIAILILMISLVLVFMVSVIIYRVLISIPLFRSTQLKGFASVIASSSGAFVNLIFIMILERIYRKLAYKLTQWEMHRTQTEFDNNLTFKVFMFQFVNYYSSIFYIAFFKGRFVGYPGHYTKMLGLRNEECSGSDCLSELAQQLAVIMIGKQTINNAQEILLPKLQNWWSRKKTQFHEDGKLTQWEEDYTLSPNEGLFQEYLEMVLQFGFITIFVAAFPLAPLFALLNNWIEIRLDAHKFVCETRRSVPERAQNIGIWFSILELLSRVAVISNAFLIAFTSDFLPRMLYMYSYDHGSLEGYLNFTLSVAPDGAHSQSCRYRDFRDSQGVHTTFFWKLLAARFAFVLIFEHVVFAICHIIDLLVPDVPQDVTIKVKRERYLAKQAFTDSEHILKIVRNEDAFDEEEGATSRGAAYTNETSFDFRMNLPESGDN